MPRKLANLMIFTVLISGLSACGFKLGTEKTTAEANSNQNGTNAAAVGGSIDKTAGESQRPANLNGMYRYKSGNSNNTISVEEKGGGRLSVAINASYEYKTGGEWNATTGEAKGIAVLKDDIATLVPDNTDGCEIGLRFLGGKIIVTSKNEAEKCGFGLNVSVDGTYTKEMDKPASAHDPKTERIRFAGGKSSTVVNGKIEHGKEKVYLIGARAGQTITIEITEGARNDGGGNNDTVFHLVAPDGSLPMGMAGEMAEFDTTWSGKLSKTGDYKIVLGTIESERVNFKMTVSIR